jgi:hypothetical protein
MKKEIILFAFAILLLGSMINLTKAEASFWQTREDWGNGIIKNHLVVQYSKDGFGIAKDYVSGNNPYEVYLWYNFYVQKWNADNPTHRITYCEWLIRYSSGIENSTTIILVNQNFTQNDADLFNAKYFVRMYHNDYLYADQICHFLNNTFSDLYIPAEMQIVTPTWECKACQYYEFSVTEKDVVKAKDIGDKVVETSNYIKKLFLLNFEIWLAMFWFFLILCIFIGVGLIFVIMYFLFLYLKRVIK